MNLFTKRQYNILSFFTFQICKIAQTFKAFAPFKLLFLLWTVESIFKYNLFSCNNKMLTNALFFIHIPGRVTLLPRIPFRCIDELWISERHTHRRSSVVGVKPAMHTRFWHWRCVGTCVLTNRCIQGFPVFWECRGAEHGTRVWAIRAVFSCIKSECIVSAMYQLIIS